MTDALVLRGGYLPVTALKYTKIAHTEYLLGGIDTVRMYGCAIIVVSVDDDPWQEKVHF